MCVVKIQERNQQKSLLIYCDKHDVFSTYLPRMALIDMSDVFSIAAIEFRSSSGVADPNATNVTAATVSGTSNCFIKTSTVGTKWLSQTSMIVQKVNSNPCSEKKIVHIESSVISILSNTMFSIRETISDHQTIDQSRHKENLIYRSCCLSIINSYSST